MKRFLIIILFAGMALTALLSGVSCSNQTPNSALLTPVITVAAGNPPWTATPTPSPTPVYTNTPTPIPYPVSGFSGPYALAIDNKNNIYVGDTGNNLVKQYVGGYINANWPSGKVKSSGLSYNSPKAIAVDSQDNLYIVGSADVVWKYDTYGNYIFQYAASASVPQGVAVYGNPASILYVSDTSNNQIFSLTLPSGASNAAFGTSGKLSLGFAPYGLAVDSNGNLYVAGGDSYVHIYTPTGSTNPANLPSVIGGFRNPYALTLDVNNNLYVSDTGNSQIEEFVYKNYSGPFSILGLGSLSNPEGIALDSSANVYVVDSGNSELFQFP